MTITGRGGIAVTVLMAMDLLCFPMVPLALIALSIDIFGYSVCVSIHYGHRDNLGLLLILFQIKGTFSPFNVVIMYDQLATVGLKLGGNLNTRLVCYTGRTFTTVVTTILGFFNLDFFHKVIPPLCLSPSFKAINVLLFDYIIASYPLFLTMFHLCFD